MHTDRAAPHPPAEPDLARLRHEELRRAAPIVQHEINNALMVLASLVIGLLLAGRSPQERITTSLVTSMRNPGLALLFASLYGQDLPGVKLGILAYLLTTVILSIPFLRWRRSLRPESLR